MESDFDLETKTGFNGWLEYKFGKCQKCFKRMKHDKGVHLFKCECGKTLWYPYRFGDFNIFSRTGIRRYVSIEEY